MIGPIFAVNAIVILVLAVLLWSFAARSGDPSFIDPCWGFGFVVIAWISLVVADDRSGIGWLLTLATSAWGLRLGGYLLWRWRKQGPDPRYEAMVAGKDNKSRYMLTHVFGLQAVMMLIVSLPVQFGHAYANADRASAMVILGGALVAFGLIFEWTADFQLTRFKADSSNRGQVMDKGLWRYSRHPNYFGDFCVWWGLFFIGVSTPITYVAIVGPLIMSVLLMRVSGVGPLEKQLHDTKPKYKDYVSKTSAFFPQLPKKLAPKK